MTRLQSYIALTAGGHLIIIANVLTRDTQRYTRNSSRLSMLESVSV